MKSSVANCPATKPSLPVNFSYKQNDKRPTGRCRVLLEYKCHMLLVRVKAIADFETCPDKNFEDVLFFLNRRVFSVNVSRVRESRYQTDSDTINRGDSSYKYMTFIIIYL